MHMMWARKYACDWQGWDGKLERMVALIEMQVWLSHDLSISYFALRLCGIECL